MTPTARLALAGFFLASVAPLSACGPGNAEEQPPQRPIPAVEAVQARTGSLPLIQRLSGVVRASNQVEIHPEISGVVTEVLVVNGSPVEAGQSLVRIRDTEFRERLKQAEANAQIARAQLRQAQAEAREASNELQRMRSLVDKQLSSQAELEGVEARAESAAAAVALAEARVAQATASVEEQQENLSQTVVRAPITGVVGNRGVEIGTLATPQTRLFTLGNLERVRVDVVLADRMLQFIEEGQRTEITVGGARLEAPLSRISPFLHPVAHSTDAEIDVANPEGVLRPGMFVTVDVFYGESEQATLVPLSALYEDPNTGLVGVYLTEARMQAGPVDEVGIQRAAPLTEAHSFRFVATPPLAEGRMEAAVPHVEEGTWVVTVGQNLLTGEDPQARVRPVHWDRVERMQRLQREDLMRSVVERQGTE